MHSPNWSDAIFDTLLRNLLYLRMGDPDHWQWHGIEKYLNEEQLIRLLTAELKANYIGEPLPQKIGTFERCTVDKYDPSKYKTIDELIYGELIGKIDIFTETAEHLRDINPWLYVAWLLEENDYTMPDPYMGVHPLDEPASKRFNKSLGKKDDAIGKCRQELYRLRLNRVPDSIQGDPLTAEVVILMRNPGFSEEYNIETYNALLDEQQREYIKSRCKTMSLFDELCVHDGNTSLGKIINDINGHYWERKLSGIFAEVPEANGKIAVVNQMPYPSIEYTAIPRKVFGDDSTQRIEQHYAPDREILKQMTDSTPPPMFYTQLYTMRLAHWLMKQGRLIVVARAERDWYKLVPGLEQYENKIVLKGRSINFSHKSCGAESWERIINTLKGKTSKQTYGSKAAKPLATSTPTANGCGKSTPLANSTGG